MKSTALALFMTVLMCQSAFASDRNLIGNWKYKQIKCASGVDSKFGSVQFAKFTFDLITTISESQILAKMNMSVIYDKAYLAQEKEKIEKAMELIKQLSPGPEKDKAIQQTLAALETFRTYENGVKCNTSQTKDYSIEGNVITSRQIHESTTCPNGNSEANKNREERVEYSISGNLLTTRSLNPVTYEAGTCPKGDYLITIFEKQG